MKAGEEGAGGRRVDSVEAMLAFGREVGSSLPPGSVVALVGGLGAGKTHWTKGLVEGMGAGAEVTSPTFGLVHEYRGGRLPVFHFDFYRLESEGELVALGWDDYLDEGGVVVAEWADRFPGMMPEGTVWYAFSVEADGGRVVRRVDP